MNNNVDSARINEVSPRDGLQNQSVTLSPEQRAELISRLIAAGLESIEIGSFVSPKVVPGMAGCDRVFALIPPKGARYSALIPNMKGYELARAAGLEIVNLVVAASDEMNRKNINMDTARALDICDEIMARAKTEGAQIEAYISTAWECPFEGRVNEHQVHQMAQRFFDGGATCAVIADTIGAAAPKAVAALMRNLVAEFGADRLRCHFHDTRAMALANIYAALETEIRDFDASLGGLGGCPFAPGASGNVATEDVALLLQQCGIEVSINMPALLEAVSFVSDLLGAPQGGKSWSWLSRQTTDKMAPH